MFAILAKCAVLFLFCCCWVYCFLNFDCHFGVSYEHFFSPTWLFSLSIFLIKSQAQNSFFSLSCLLRCASASVPYRFFPLNTHTHTHLITHVHLDAIMPSKREYSPFFNNRQSVKCEGEKRPLLRLPEA